MNRKRIFEIVKDFCGTKDNFDKTKLKLVCDIVGVKPEEIEHQISLAFFDEVELINKEHYKLWFACKLTALEVGLISKNNSLTYLKAI